MADIEESAAKTVGKSAAELTQSAGEMKSSAQDLSQSADRTTQLAADRTVLAVERTYAAWVRTGLAALVSGVGAKALLTGVVSNWLVGLTGSILILFSAFCFFAAIWREFEPGVPSPTPDVRRLPTPLLLTVNGVLILVAAAALVGIWFRTD